MTNFKFELSFNIFLIMKYMLWHLVEERERRRMHVHVGSIFDHMKIDHMMV